MKVVISARAKADLISISAHVARDNERAAQDLRRQIVTSIGSLAESPHRGRPGRVAGTRELIISKSYIAAYRIGANDITVLTIRHTARLWPRSFE